MRWDRYPTSTLADSSDPDDYSRSSYNFSWPNSPSTSPYRRYTDTTDSELLPNIHHLSSYDSTREQTPEATSIELPGEGRGL